MADQLQLLLEAQRRGLLPPAKMQMLDEARRRGLLGVPAQPPGAGPGFDPTAPETPGAMGNNPMAQGSPAPAPATPPTDQIMGKAPPPDWSQPTLVPLSHNRKTGEWKWAVPAVLGGAMDAAALPGDALSGKYDNQLDPRLGMRTLGPGLIGRSLGFAGTFAGGEALPAASADAVKSLGGAAGDQFGIPLTKGQASGSLADLTKEEALRQGNGSASNIMRNFDAAQRDVIGQQAGKIGSELGSNPESMADSVVQAIRDRVAFHKDQASAYYKIGSDGGASIAPEMVQALPQVVDSALNDAAVTVDERLTPGAAVAMGLLKKAGNLEGALTPTAGKGAGGAAGGDVTGVSLDGIEQIRKQIVGLGNGANETDGRAIRAIKKAVDDWEQTAVDNMLVSGDDRALDAIKKGRMASGEYLRVTNPAEGDQAGAAVAKMAKGDATSEEVANWLYGANVASPTLNAPKVAARVKELVGADGPEWQSVRADVWQRLTQDMASGDLRSNTMIAKRIETFLNDKGSTLSSVLYTPEERAKMQSFADALKATVTPRDATNPSRTAWTLGNSMAGISRLAAGVLAGTTTGNPMVGLGVTASLPIFKNIGARRAALIATGAKEPKSLGPLANNAFLGALRTGDISMNSLSAPVPPATKPVMSLDEWVQSQRSAGNMAF